MAVEYYSANEAASILEVSSATVRNWTKAYSDDYAKAFEALERGDYEAATFYLSFFASNGDSVAQYNLGLLYRDGLGVEKNPHVEITTLNI